MVGTKNCEDANVVNYGGKTSSNKTLHKIYQSDYNLTNCKPYCLCHNLIIYEIKIKKYSLLMWYIV